MKHLRMRPEEDAIVLARHAAGVRDTHIAAEIGRSQSQVHRTRERLGLVAVHGPGSPDGDERPRTTTPLGTRLWKKVEIGRADECWPWTGARNGRGYGRLAAGRRDEGLVYAHRAVFELSARPLVDGETIDHLCRNTSCCNPAHLEPVPLAENIRRAKRRLTHCKHGHEFTPENTYWRKEGRRMCRACGRSRQVAA